MKRTISFQGTVTLHIPFRFAKRAGQKELQLPDSAKPTLRADRQNAGQGAGTRVPLEANSGIGRVRHHRRTGRARGDSTLLHDPRPASDPALARDSRGDPRRESTRRDAGARAGAVSGGVGAPVLKYLCRKIERLVQLTLSPMSRLKSGSSNRAGWSILERSSFCFGDVENLDTAQCLLD